MGTGGGEFPKPTAAPREHLTHELSTMIVGVVIRLTHQSDPFVYKNTKRGPFEHRVVHIRCCARCQEMLAAVHPDIEALFERLADEVRR